MNNHCKIIEAELLERPTATMRQYLVHFNDDARKFIVNIVKATDILENKPAFSAIKMDWFE